MFLYVIGKILLIIFIFAADFCTLGWNSKINNKYFPQKGLIVINIKLITMNIKFLR